MKSAYAELKCALKNSGSNLEKLQESLEKCREVGVIERLLSQVFSIYCDIAHKISFASIIEIVYCEGGRRD